MMMSLAEFKRVFTHQQVRVMQIIYIALGIGATFYLGFVVFLFFYVVRNGPPSDSEFQLARLILYSAVGLSILAYFASFLVFEAFLRKLSAIARNPEASAEAVCQILRTGMIVRVAIFEAAAFLGLFSASFSALVGVLQEDSIFWLGLAPYMLLLVLIVHTFPTRIKIESLFQEKTGCY